jgi:hypothetical protein
MIRWGGLLILLVPLAARAQSDNETPPPRRDAAQVARDGTFLPFTLSARIGDQRVSGMALGGYDGAGKDSGTFAANVEGALWNRVALRVGVDYSSARVDAAAVSVGLRLGLLRQEKHHVDLGLGAFYKQQGFTESNGEIEMVVSLARRWNKIGLYANLIYGQGFTAAERDGEARVAALYAVGERFNVGLDSRVRGDLGHKTAARVEKGLESDLELVAGATASAAFGPIALLATVGFHGLLVDQTREDFRTGAIAQAGIAAAF